MTVCNACAIIASDGTVALRNASQYHTIYYKVQPSKECPNFFSGSMPPPRGTGFIPGRAEQVESFVERSFGARRNPLTTSICPYAQHFAHQDGIALAREDVHSLNLL